MAQMAAMQSRVLDGINKRVSAALRNFGYRNHVASSLQRDSCNFGLNLDTNRRKSPAVVFENCRAPMRGFFCVALDI
jgi:hypothetical protein